MKKHAPTASARALSALAPVLTVIAFFLNVLPGHAQDNSLFRHIPPDAGSVYRVDLGAIQSKIGWDDLVKTLPLAKMHLGPVEKAISDPASAGVDIHGDVVVASTNEGMMDSVRYVVYMFHLLDSARFRAFIHQQIADSKIMRNSDKTFSVLLSKKTALTWNNQLCIVVVAEPPMKEMMSALEDKSKDGKQEPGKTKTPTTDHGPSALKKSLAVMKGYGDNYYTTDPIFKAQFSDGADIMMCNEHGSYLKGLTKMIPPTAMGGMDPGTFDLFAKKFTEFRFENGRMAIRGRLILKPDAAANMQKYHSPSFNSDVVARIPQGSLLGLASIRFDPAMVGDMIRKFGLQQKFDSSMNAKGIDPSDFGKAFKGDFTIAVLGTDRKDSSSKPKPTIYFIAPVGDMTALHHLGMELVKAAAKDSAEAAADTSKHKKHDGDGLRHIIDHSAVHDGMLVISKSKEQSEAYFTNTDKRNTDFVTGDLRESPAFVWIDIQAIIKYISDALANQPNQQKTQMMLDKLQVLDKLIITGGGLHNGEVNTSFELRTTHPDENVLKTLMNALH